MATEPKSSGKVCVACKLPHGLRIQFYDTKNPNLPPTVSGDPILLAGTNHEHAVGGYGITVNVDADKFNGWLAQNKEYPAVKNNLIFAEPDYDRIRARALEQSRVLSGFEGLDAEKPPGGVLVDNYEGRPKQPE
jgi:hypothetical protein